MLKQIITWRVERKFQLCHNIVGDDDATDLEKKETESLQMGDLRSIILGLYIFNPKGIDHEESDGTKMLEFNSLADKVIGLHDGQVSEKDLRKFEVRPTDILDGRDLLMKGSSAFCSFDPDLHEASYLSWVEKFKELSESGNSPIMELT